MIKINNLKPEKILEFLVIYFPIFFFLRSFTLNSILLIISIIFIYVCIQNKLNIFKNNINKLLILFFVYFSISQLFIYEDYKFFLKSLFLLKFFFLINAILYIWSKINLKKLREKLKYLNIVFIIFILDIYYQYFFNQNVLGFPAGFCSGPNNECLRFSGIFDQELIAGAYISLVVVSLFISAIILKKKFINFLIPIVLLITVFVTGERTALIFTSIFVILFYSIFFKDIKNKFKILSIIIISLYLSFNYVITETTKKRFSISTFKDLNIINHDLKNLKLVDKLKLTPWGLHYQASLLMVMDKPFFGNGLKSFRYKCADYNYLKYALEPEKRVRVSGYEVCTTHPHQFHLEILTDSGIIGYIIFLIFVFYYLKSIYTSTNKLDNKYHILVFVYLLTLIFFPRPTGSIFSTTFGSMFWYALGTLYGSIKFYEKNKKIINNELN